MICLPGDPSTKVLGYFHLVRCADDNYKTFRAKSVVLKALLRRLNSCPGSPLRHKLITVAAHGEKMPRLLRVGFQLLPQPAHVNVNGAGQHSGFIAPNLAQQFIARKRSAALGDKVAQQLKLSRGEFDLLTVAMHLSAPKVYNDRAKAKRVERLCCARC